MRRVAFFLLGAMLICSVAEAKLATMGSGDTLTFDPSGWPAEMQEANKVMAVKCIKCHTMERTVVSIQTGVAPINGGLFDKTATKKYGIKMLRKPDSDMSKEDIKTVIKLLNYLLDNAE